MHDQWRGWMIAPMIVLALAVHILSAVVAVGGMFAAYVCLRPAMAVLETQQRCRLWRGFFGKFFPLVWLCWILIVASGYWIMSIYFGGFAGAPPYVNIMQALGWLIILLFALMFHGPWRRFKRAVDADDWPAAAAALSHIRIIIQINLPLALIVVIVGGTGRYWSY